MRTQCPADPRGRPELPRCRTLPPLSAGCIAGLSVAALPEAVACNAARVPWLSQENAELLAARPREGKRGARYRTALEAPGESFLAERRVATTTNVVVLGVRAFTRRSA
jgi:hypothetical protein